MPSANVAAKSATRSARSKSAPRTSSWMSSCAKLAANCALLGCILVVFALSYVVSAVRDTRTLVRLSLRTVGYCANHLPPNASPWGGSSTASGRQQRAKSASTSSRHSPSPPSPRHHTKPTTAKPRPPHPPRRSVFELFDIPPAPPAPLPLPLRLAQRLRVALSARFPVVGAALASTRSALQSLRQDVEDGIWWETYERLVPASVRKGSQRSAAVLSALPGGKKLATTLYGRVARWGTAIERVLFDPPPAPAPAPVPTK
ncbi:hypothetical protein RI367_004616 [Sorochytrium milnesiophthora]